MHNQESHPRSHAARPAIGGYYRMKHHQQRSIYGPHEQLLINEMRDLGHGRIEDVPIRNGVPGMNRNTKVMAIRRAGRNETARTLTTMWLHRNPHHQHRTLFAECRRIGTGVLERIEVADGLPIFWKLAEPKSSQRA